ncbi:MAG: hypothetical protein HZA50_11525 [Planctomycetes bacterium]|nr:hypothetical protein [Planctomycetota bacterium]
MKTIRFAAIGLVLIVADISLAQTAAPPSAAAKPAAGDPQAIPVWQSGFEDPSLGDWTWLSPSFSRDGKIVSGRMESYMITTENAFSGRYAYKGWIVGAQTENHRAYPCHSFKVESPIVNSWYVWLDCNPAKFNDADWIHFATWCNSNWGPGLHTMAVRTKALELEMAHCEWKWVGPPEMRKFPLKKWVRFTYYAHYRPAGDGKIWVWMDGKLIFEAQKNHNNQFFEQVHWGMYAHPHVDNGVQYNDDIQLWRLSAPWTDKNREPPSPYKSDPKAAPPAKTVIDLKVKETTAVSNPPAENPGGTGPAANPVGKPKLPEKPKVEEKPRPVVTSEKLVTMEDWVAKLKFRLALYLKSGQTPKFQCRTLDARVTVESMDGGGQLTLVDRVGKKTALEWEKLTLDDYIGLTMDMAGMTDTALDHALLAYFYHATEQAEKAQEHLKKAGSYEKAVKEATGM